MPGIDVRHPLRSLSRRRFIAISGAVAGVSLLKGKALASSSIPLHRWEGIALGADASMILAHPDKAVADRLIERCIVEMRRLERIFSLYDANSILVRLNRLGAIDQPPLEMVELLSRAQRISELTGGIFDVTVQPLWLRYASHFSQTKATSTGPDISAALGLVDWRQLHVEPERVAFARSGMAVTLNGIAQGFITDRIVQLLRSEGIGQVMVDLGEIRAIGRHPIGRPWHAGIKNPMRDGDLVGKIDLIDRALATSGGYGTVFDVNGRYSHLIDPRDGHTAPLARSVSVVARDATTADALSTAFSLVGSAEIQALLPRFPDISVYVADGSSLHPFHS